MLQSLHAAALDDVQVSVVGAAGRGTRIQRIWAPPFIPQRTTDSYAHSHRTSCGHLFCLSCAESHFSKDPHCPVEYWYVRSAVRALAASHPRATETDRLTPSFSTHHTATSSSRRSTSRARSTSASTRPSPSSPRSSRVGVSVAVLIGPNVPHPLTHRPSPHPCRCLLLQPSAGHHPERPQCHPCARGKTTYRLARSSQRARLLSLTYPYHNSHPTHRTS